MPFDGVLEEPRVRAGVLAHDFNNLLGVILCASEALAQQLPEGSESRELARLSQDAAERGAELLRRLLEPSPSVPEPCDAAEAVRAKARRATLAAPPGVTVDLRLPEAPLPCAADLSDLESALLNLCVNAGHAMPEGGSLKLSVRADADEVAISVRDTGVGMSPKVLARATEPYFTTRRGRGGAGLGLSSVEAFARRSGGRLELASRKGRGTRATIYLPRD